MILLTQKYKPHNVEDLFLDVNMKKKLFSMKKKKCIPNLILSGPPGSGKTSTIFCLANELFKNINSELILKMNISEEKGLSVIREKTKSFCSRDFSKKRKRTKLVILDEADSMNETSQGALCRMIEKFSKNVRFVLICNFPSKIIEPIQSRCAILRFKKLKENLSLEFLLKIFKNEKIYFDLSSVEFLIFLADGDMRKILNQTEMLIGDSKKMKIGSIRKILPKFQTWGALDFVFNIFRNETKIAEEILFDIFNQGNSKLDFINEFFGIIKKVGLKNYQKLKLLSHLSKSRLDFQKNFSFLYFFEELKKTILKFF
mmetsp:Transcript_53728/g.127050  ORF Transcript_53728/g.127050 Transcript_53728/m.127050 type:complete len:315 (+) Transcript_53728:60-1004(+)